MVNIQQVMNNPMLKQIMQSGNPQQFMMNMIKNNPKMKDNPVLQNAMKMYQNKDGQGLETLGRNLAKEAGLDPDEMLRNINGMMRK